MTDLPVWERPAASEPAGAVVLLHGRDSSERDFSRLYDDLDPDGRLPPVAEPSVGHEIDPARLADARALVARSTQVV